ncbi:hypothetical protein [Nocardioides sp. 503]|uniref:hypothetical protein n=1 Tax=Nocardioides sp. 503 TaxID=2508326 RepID=UPI00106FD320|nr:hypothetical protein [Nocardioides sp. 503]
MRPALPAALALLLTLTACAQEPDTAAAERDLAAVDGVVDADVRWVEGSFKVPASAALAVAVGEDLTTASVDRLVPGLLDAVADLGWDGDVTLAVQVSDEADGSPFVPRPPGKGQVPQPTDVTVYSASVGSLEDRDLAADLSLLVEARDVLGGQAQLRAEGGGTSTLTAELETDAVGSVGLVEEASARRTLTVDDLTWRVSGRGLLLEVESALTPADGLLWAAVVDGTSDLGGLERERLVLSVDAEQGLTVVSVELRAEGPVAEATGAVSRRAQELQERWAGGAGVDEVRVEVTGTDGSRSRTFFEGATEGWEPGA